MTSHQKRVQNHFSSRNQLETQWAITQLEDRILLAADAGAAVDSAIPAEIVAESNGGQTRTQDSRRADVAEHPQQPATLVVIDAKSDSDQAMQDAIESVVEGNDRSSDDVRMLLIGDDDDALAVISAAIADSDRALAAIHLIGHGDAGKIQLGATVFDQTMLSRRAGELRQWGNGLTDDADILIYGCESGRGMVGERFVKSLAKYTGADVAASTNATGNQDNADWVLERRVGRINALPLLTAMNTVSMLHNLPIDVFAAGSTNAEQMQLEINGSVIATWDNIGGDFDNRDFVRYRFENTQPVNASDIQVRFTNDAFDQETGLDRNLLIDRIVVDGVTFETEADDTFSTGTFVPGEGITPGFKNSEILHANGFFAYDQISDPDDTTLRVLAAGQTGSEQMNLLIDGAVVQTWNNVGGDAQNRQFETFTYDPGEFIDASRIQVQFANDGLEAGADRNLRVDSIRVGGRILQTESNSVFSTGTWLPDDGLSPGFRGSEWLHANGTFTFDAVNRGGSIITVDAAGAVGDESFELQIDGVRVLEVFTVGGDAATREFETFFYSADTNVDVSQVRVEFTNDSQDGGQDRNLRVDRITVDGIVFESEDPAVFSTGTWKPEDGVTDGFRESEFLHANGYLQYGAREVQPGFLSIADSTIQVDENASVVLIDVQRTGGADGNATVQYDSLDDAAILGLDYEDAAGTLQFVDGQTVATISIPILDDLQAEALETFNVTIDNPTGVTGLLAPRTATVSIIDDDAEYPVYDDFSDTTGINFNGNATRVGNEIRLTTAGANQAGSAFFENRINVNESSSFQTNFRFRAINASLPSGLSCNTNAIPPPPS
ncbi:MAG: carbohydrate-binding domain-containing protein, partial [Planctomycetota bacterium]